jgi:translation initiation factor 2B subunit (eIF-2B alpha/beta/delta family)
MSRGRDHHAKEAPQREELAEQLTAARQEVVDARAKAVTNAMAFERLQKERDQLVHTMEGLHGKLEATGQERDNVMRLSEEREEQARFA